MNFNLMHDKIRNILIKMLNLFYNLYKFFAYTHIISCIKLKFIKIQN